jgi:hypothetical protein
MCEFWCGCCSPADVTVMDTAHSANSRSQSNDALSHGGVPDMYCGSTVSGKLPPRVRVGHPANPGELQGSHAARQPGAATHTASGLLLRQRQTHRTGQPWPVQAGARGAPANTRTAAAQNSWLWEVTLPLPLAGSRLLWMLGSTPPVRCVCGGAGGGGGGRGAWGARRVVRTAGAVMRAGGTAAPAHQPGHTPRAQTHTRGDGHGAQQLAQLLVVAHGELDVAGDDPEQAVRGCRVSRCGRAGRVQARAGWVLRARGCFAGECVDVCFVLLQSPAPVLLVVARGVAGELQQLSSEVLQHGGEVHGRARADALGIPICVCVCGGGKAVRAGTKGHCGLRAADINTRGASVLDNSQLTAECGLRRRAAVLHMGDGPQTTRLQDVPQAHNSPASWAGTARLQPSQPPQISTTTVQACRLAFA